MEWIHSLNTLRAREFNLDGFYYGSTGVCGIGSIGCVLLFMVKDKNYLCHSLKGR